MDKTLSEKLQLEAELTLDRAINHVRQMEAVRKKQTVLRAEEDQADVDYYYGHQNFTQKVNSGKETPGQQSLPSRNVTGLMDPHMAE